MQKGKFKVAYVQLNRDERFYIEKRLSCCEFVSIRQLSRELGRSHTAISREISRNTDTSFGFYSGLRANNLSLDKRNSVIASKSKRIAKLPKECMTFILNQLKARTSPEQICGRLKREFSVVLGVSTLYRYIQEDKANGGKLYLFLRHGKKRYKARNSNLNDSQNNSRLQNRVSIHNRPDIANQKTEPGHWEADTVYGLQQKSYLLTLTDKATKYEIIKKIPNKESQTILKEMQNIVATTLLPFKTITSDNGTEFALHEHIAEKTNAAFYFANPYSSWERGLNEHQNGLIRDFLPKKTDFREYDNMKFREIENNLNNRPRKSLGYLTPAEAITNYIAYGNISGSY